MITFVVNKDIEKVNQLQTCPLVATQIVDEDDGSIWELRVALLHGQERGWVNFNEYHHFEILDVERVVRSSVSCLVWNVQHQEKEIYMFVN